MKKKKEKQEKKETVEQGKKSVKQGKKSGKGGVFRFLGWGAIFPILAEAGIGILLFSLPENSWEVLSVYVGVIFCVLGVLLLVTSFLLKKAGILRLAMGAAFVGAAVWLFIQRKEAVTVLLYILFGAIFLRALLGMWNALSQNRNRLAGHWWQIQFTVCLVILLCAFVLFFPQLGFSVRSVVTGALYVANAAVGLCSRLARLFSPKIPEEEKVKTPKKKNEPIGEPAPTVGEPPVQASEEPTPKRRFSFGRKKKRNPHGEE